MKKSPKHRSEFLMSQKFSGSSAGLRESALHRSASSPQPWGGNYSLFILCVFHVSALDSNTTERSLVGIINVFSEDLLIRKSEYNNTDSDNRWQCGRARDDLWLLQRGRLIQTRIKHVLQALMHVRRSRPSRERNNYQMTFPSCYTHTDTFSFFSTFVPTDPITLPNLKTLLLHLNRPLKFRGRPHFPKMFSPC